MRHLLLSTDKLRINNVIIAGLLIYTAVNFAGAQETDSISVQQQVPAKSAQEDVRPKAVPLGSFLLYPDLTVSGVFDDNIFATPPGTKEDDYIMIVSPSALIKSQWSEHELSLGAGADIGRYATNNDEDYEDYWVEADGRYDMAARSNVFGGIRFIRDHEDRASPDDVNGVKPTTFDEYGGHAGLLHQIERTALRLGGTFTHLDYDNVPSTFGTINNDDRDRDMYTVGARIGFGIPQNYEPFLQGSYDARRYDLDVDDNGFNRDSEGFRVAAGIRLTFPPRVSAEVLAGYLHQDYNDAELEDVSTPDFSARLSWRPTVSTTITGYADRSLEETTLAGASAYLFTTGGATIRHRLRPRLELNTGFSISESDFRGIERTDDYVEMAAGLSYFLSPHFVIEADYQFLHRDSTDNSQDYYRNQIGLKLRGQLYTLDRSRFTRTNVSAQMPSSYSTAGGPYVGAHVGVDGTDTKLHGPREAGETLTAKLGDYGVTGGLFGGYGIALKRWYLGVDLEGEASNAKWEYSKSPDGRRFSLEKGASYGASARLGRVFGESSLLYGRVGAVETKFDTHYVTGATTVNQDNDQTGLRYGIGAEVMATDRMFLRFDYSYTDYDEYNVDFGAGRDTFDNRESVFRAGLGYRWGSIQSQPNRNLLAAKIAGFFGGAQLGHGQLNTNLEALQRGTNGNQDLVADFSDHGASWGLFGGYGIVDDSWYVGVELEGEASQARWDYNRHPFIRAFSVEKNFSYGGGARIGYVLPQNALVYGRFGVVRTDFNTQYLKGIDLVNQVDRNDTLTGIRFGVGMEIPTTERIFIRLDYSYTDYDPYSFTTPQAFPDTVKFDNNESLFRLGIGVRL